MENTNGQQGEKKRKINRSSGYPYVGLEEAIALTKKVRDGLGTGPYDREAMAEAMDHESVTGAAAGKVAALVHFGLIERTGNTYKQSELADRILVPVSEEDREGAIRDAVSNPRLYNQVVAKYQGQALPRLLENILVREHNITSRVSKDVAAKMRDSFLFAGLLENGVLSSQDSDKANKPSVEKTSELAAGQQLKSRSIKIEADDRAGFELVAGVWIYYPQELGVHFNLGEFATPLKQLRAAISKATGAHVSENVEQESVSVEEESSTLSDNLSASKLHSTDDSGRDNNRGLL